MYTFFTNLDRPESSLTVASECSSTISSEEEVAVASKSHEKVSGKSPPSPTNSSISDDEDDSGGGGDTWNTPTNQSTPIKDLNNEHLASTASKSSLTSKPEASKSEDQKKVTASTGNRLSSLFKIPKFKLKGSAASNAGASASEPNSLEATPSKANNSQRPAFSRSNSMSSESGISSSFVRNNKERHSYRAPSATSRYNNCQM